MGQWLSRRAQVQVAFNGAASLFLVVVDIDEQLVGWVADRVREVLDGALEVDVISPARVNAGRRGWLFEDHREGVSHDHT